MQLDEYLETVTQKGNAFFYKYGNEEKPFVASQVTVKYKTDRGMEEKLFTVFRTHHGPVVRELNGKWVTIRLMQESRLKPWAQILHPHQAERL